MKDSLKFKIWCYSVLLFCEYAAWMSYLDPFQWQDPLASFYTEDICALSNAQKVFHEDLQSYICNATLVPQNNPDLSFNLSYSNKTIFTQNKYLKVESDEQQQQQINVITVLFDDPQFCTNGLTYKCKWLPYTETILTTFGGGPFCQKNQPRRCILVSEDSWDILIGSIVTWLFMAVIQTLLVLAICS